MTTLQELYGADEELLKEIAILLVALEQEWADKEDPIRHVFEEIQKIEDKTAREIALIVFFGARYRESGGKKA